MDTKKYSKVRSFGVILVSTVMLVMSSCQKASFFTSKPDSGIFLVKLNGKYGFINKSGKVLINPQFDAAGNFYDGLAVVKSGEKWGYINKSGKIVINPQFEQATNFYEGLAAVKLGGKWGYINKSGNIVINPQFESAGFFSQGLADVGSTGGGWIKQFGFIDKSGKYVINPQFDGVSFFNEGLATASNGRAFGYINKSGEYVINPQFDQAWVFTDGLAMVRLGNKLGFINKSGKYIINPQFDTANWFQDGLAAVCNGGKCGYIDKTGKYIISPQFDSANDFHDGLAAVETGVIWKSWMDPWLGKQTKKISGKWGYIDKTGKIVVEPHFDGAGDFRDGLGLVTIGSHWAYIDKTGKYVWAVPFQQAVEKHLAKAKELFDSKKLDLALKEINEALRYNLNNEQASTMKQQITEEITQLQTNIQNEAKIISLLKSAHSLFNSGKYDEAIQNCDEVLKIDPQNQQATELKNKIVKTKQILGQ
jgi:tetratricopeptide (TPR) repeat protein